MKKIILSFLAFAFALQVRADEGMWIPMLIGKNIEDMQKMGFHLTAQDVYNVNHASLKDAIVHFGGGCTGEMVSPNGLLFTNHHCGYGSIAALSTVENNYLDNGFWAKKYEEEIPAPGLTVKFLVRMEDVTAQLEADWAAQEHKSKRKQKSLEDLKRDIEENAAEQGKYEAQVATFYNGNQYFLLVYQVYKDVRLVGTPPKSLGKFGGDTDNWMWPRHTADFSIFRVYADKNNNPAEYSKDNVPYQPKKYLPVSIKGVKESDYAMVMGYPGRTNRYETSYGVALAINDVNPSIVKIRNMRLTTMREFMQKDPAVNLKLSSRYASIANYWKYYIGQTEQLKRLKVIDEKQQQEKAFTDWAKTANRPDAEIMSKFAKAYSAYQPYAKHNVYYSECFKGSAVANLAASAHDLYTKLKDKKVKRDEILKGATRLRDQRAAMMKYFDYQTEQALLAKTAKMFYEDIPQGQQPSVYQTLIFKQFGDSDWNKTFSEFAKYVFANSFLLNDARFESFVSHPNIADMEADPALQYAFSFVENYQDNYSGKYVDFTQTKNELAKQYIKGLMEKNQDKSFYPDANSTMRVTYGSVGGYSPQDAVSYNYYTTIEGLLAKYQPGDDEFDLPADFLKLADAKTYGRYADAHGDLVTCFITNDDITGGNSGSPVINANGELIGLAFDGNWEAMSGDIAFDKKYKRTIAVDIRFVLWLIDEYGGAKNIIQELDLR